MLRITNLVSGIGHAIVLKNVSLHVSEREIVTLIGANGAGKSTLLNTIAGIVKPRQGEIELQGKNVAGLSPMNLVRAGIALVPEGRQLFAPLTVMDNLILGAYHHYTRASRQDVRDQLDTILQFFPILNNRSQQLAGTLSGGEQQMLAIARALMTQPKLLLLDEPSMGLAPKIVEEIFDKINELRKQNLTVLLVEQNARMALELADRAYVVETGQIVMEGGCADLIQNPEIERAYLGQGYQEIWD